MPRLSKQDQKHLEQGCKVMAFVYLVFGLVALVVAGSMLKCFRDLLVNQ